MQPSGIEITGLRVARKAMRELPKEVRTEFNRAAKTATNEVRDEAKRLVPRRSGALAKSIKSKTRRGSGWVFAGAESLPYTRPIHFGWPTRPNKAKGWRGGPIRPQPFLYEAADHRRPAVLAAYEAGVAKACALIQQDLNTSRE